MTSDLEALRRELPSDLEPIRLLGAGSMASVYLAREVPLRRLVAVKVATAEVVADPVARGRFEREAQAAARLEHPHIVSVHRIGALPSGVPYLVMEYVEGKTLEDQLTAGGPLPPAESRAVLATVADALAAAHRVGIVHRDVRPANILLERETGRAVLADFGIAGVLETASFEHAHLTRPGELLGEMRHMSPEQLRGEPVTAAADVYSLGVVGYELLTGKGPFGDASELDLVIAPLEREPPRLALHVAGVDAELSELLHRCLARNPAHRPTAAEVAAALARPAAAHDSLEGFLTGLIRRRVAPAAALYLAAVWALLNFVDQLVDQNVLPPITYHLLLGPLVGGLLVVGVLTWYHGLPGRQEFRRSEGWLLVGAAVLGLAISAGLILRG